MRIFNFLKEKTLVTKQNKQFNTTVTSQKQTSPYPKQYSQNSNYSIVTSDGIYDFTRFSEGEKNTILEVLDCTNKKYPREYRSVGLAMEAFGIVYKPRYILHEIIILKYANSKQPIDQLAVGLAYLTKGAVYRKEAIQYIEKSINNISSADINFISSTFPLWSIYNSLSDLYEQEYEFDKALKYAELATKNKTELSPYDFLHPGRIYKKIDINMSINYYEQILKNKNAQQYRDQIEKELQKARELANRNYLYKPRKYKQSESSNELNNQIESAALKFLSYLN